MRSKKFEFLGKREKKARYYEPREVFKKTGPKYYVAGGRRQSRKRKQARKLN